MLWAQCREEQEIVATLEGMGERLHTVLEQMTLTEREELAEAGHRLEMSINNCTPPQAGGRCA